MWGVLGPAAGSAKFGKAEEILAILVYAMLLGDVRLIVYGPVWFSFHCANAASGSILFKFGLRLDNGSMQKVKRTEVHLNSPTKPREYRVDPLDFDLRQAKSVTS